MPKKIAHNPEFGYRTIKEDDIINTSADSVPKDLFAEVLLNYICAEKCVLDERGTGKKEEEFKKEIEVYKKLAGIADGEYYVNSGYIHLWDFCPQQIDPWLYWACRP